LEQPINNFSKPKLEIGKENVKLEGIENTLILFGFNNCFVLIFIGLELH
jgi:hypothetical protein